MTTEEVIGRELEPDEKLLWCGRPLGGFRLRPADAAMVPFGLFFLTFSIFLVVSAAWGASNAGGPGGLFAVFPLFGLPFVAVGFYMAFGRFFVDARVRSRTWYALTEQRIIVVSGLFATTTRSVDLSGIAEVVLREKRDGSGSIQFLRVGVDGHGDGQQASGVQTAQTKAVPAFELIENAREVYRLAREAQRLACHAEMHA